jgi:hypothetical protein
MIITMQMVIAHGNYNDSLDKTSIGFKSDHQLDKLHMIIFTIMKTFHDYLIASLLSLTHLHGN